MAITRPINHYYEDAEAGQDLHSPFLDAGQKHFLAKPPPNVQSCEYILIYFIRISQNGHQTFLVNLIF